MATGFEGSGRELVTIKLENYASVKEGLAKLETGIQNMAKYKAYVGSKAPYAFGVEEGYHEKSGGLARRAGGAYYLQGAVNTVLSSANADLQAGMDKYGRPGPWVLARLIS